MEYVRNFILDLDPCIDLPVIHVERGGQQQDTIDITLVCGAGYWEPEQDVIFTMRCKRPDSTTVILNSEMADESSGDMIISANGNVITIKLIEQLYAVVGKSYCDIVITKDNERISSGRFIIDVFELPDYTET